VKGRWLYLANARVPSEKAHVFQIFQMLDGFTDAGLDVELVHPRRDNLSHLENVDPQALYGLRHAPRMRSVRTLDAIKLVTIDIPPLNRPPIPALAFGAQSVSFAVNAALCARGANAKVLYSRDWPVLAAASISGKPAIWEAHDLPQSRAARTAIRALLPRLAGIVCITRGLRDELQSLGVAGHRLLVAPDAVDLARFTDMPSREDARRQLGLPSGARMVAYTGHLYSWKGAHALARASRLLPDGVEVCIVGGTPADLVSFRRFVAEERLDRVRVIGHVPPKDVPTWLAAADVLALPNSGRESISARYTSPLKLYEYMASGRPIVASDLPSLREALTHGENAWFVAPDNPAALAAGISAILDDPARAGAMAERARKSVQGHTWTVRAERIVAFVSRVLEAEPAT